MNRAQHIDTNIIFKQNFVELKYVKKIFLVLHESKKCKMVKYNYRICNNL